MQRHGRALLALCLLLCHASSQGPAEGGVVRFESGAARRLSPAVGRGLVAHELPEGVPVSGTRAERLLRSVPSPGVGH